METSRRMTFLCLLAAVALGLLPEVARADDKLGGHFGAVFPLVSRAGGKTTNIGDDFKVGFPMGISVKKNDTWTFDLELVPFIDPNSDSVQQTPLLVHPGIIKGLGNGLALGLRFGFEINGGAWGFTPLLNKGLGPGGKDANPFIEAVVPIRFTEPTKGDHQTAIGFGIHIGLGF